MEHKNFFDVIDNHPVLTGIVAIELISALGKALALAICKSKSKTEMIIKPDDLETEKEEPQEIIHI